MRRIILPIAVFVFLFFSSGVATGQTITTSVSAFPGGFTTTYGTASTAQSFTVSGSSLSNNITITVPLGFEVSKTSATTGFAATQTLTPTSGIVLATTIFVRLSSTAPVTGSPYSGNVACAATGAPTKNVAIPSSVVSKAALTVTADNKTKVYGAANPAFTLTYAGFVGTDNAASLTTAPTAVTAATATSAVGTYSITVSGGVSSNYNFTYVSGTLTITKAVLTVTADDKTKVYTTANPTLTLTYAGFAGTDNAASLTTAPTASTTATTLSPVGTYPITVSGGVSANYSFNYVSGTLTVTKVILTVTADNKSKVYGAVNPALTLTYAGFVGTDNVASLNTAPTAATTATTLSAAGAYTITVSGGVSSNYTFSYVSGTLTITKAALTVTADNKTKVYGAANPALTLTYTGFVGTDNIASLTTAPTAVTTAGTLSPVTTYPITVSGGVSSNYTFNYGPGTLTITKAILTVTADDKTRVYGAANPVLTITYAGFAGADNATSLTTAPTASTTATILSTVGTYTISVSGGVSSNYTFDYHSGTLTISKKSLVITARDTIKCQGSLLVFNTNSGPNQSFNVSGLVNSDRVDNIQLFSLGTPVLAPPAVLPTPDSITASNATGTGLVNYNITYVKGVLIVNPKPSVTNTDKTICDNTRLSLLLTSNLPNCTFTWTALPPFFGAGSGTTPVITDSLSSGTPTTILDIVRYKISAKTLVGGCSSDFDTIKVFLKLLPSVPTITALPANLQLCQGSSQNYAASVGSVNSTTVNPAVLYQWSTNANLILQSLHTDTAGKNAVIKFPGAGPYNVSATATVQELNGCSNTGTISVGSLGAVANPTRLIYNGNDFVCLNNDVDSYQWGYDDNDLVSHFYSSGEAPFLTAQNLTRPGSDTLTRFVWVITKSGTCFTKTYCDTNNPYPRRPGAVIPTPVSQTAPLKIYPNPVTNEAVISWNYSSPADDALVTIMDITGKKVLVKTLAGGAVIPGRISVNVSGLQRGIYIVNVLLNSRSSVTGKLVKN